MTNVVHKVRKAFTPKSRREKLEEQHQEQTATQVVDTVGEMKGLAMKIGQQASYLATGVTPQPMAEQLARLQQDAPPMDSSIAARVVKESLGAPPEVVFAEWGPTPVAAASIGQVHRAVTQDGSVVAVKLQYPGAESALRADLDNLGTLGNVAIRRGQRAESKAGRATTGNGIGGSSAPASASADPISMSGMLDQFKARLLQETDYEREAANQDLIEQAFRGDARILVPRVHRELSSKTVLTTDFATGARFAEILTWDQDQRDMAGETLFRFHYECAFRVGYHNADPHPGNYIFARDGVVTFLDFGALWELPREFVEGVPRLLDVLCRATVETRETEVDRSEFAKLSARPSGGRAPSPMVTLGWFYDQFVVPGARTLPSPMDSLLQSVSGARTFTFAEDDDEAFVAEMAQRIGQSANALLGVQAVLSTLGARCDWNAIGRRTAEFLST